jgi:hypothetical protein
MRLQALCGALRVDQPNGATDLLVSSAVGFARAGDAAAAAAVLEYARFLGRQWALLPPQFAQASPCLGWSRAVQGAEAAVRQALWMA